MTSERWLALQRLFDAAVSLGSDARTDFLARECDGDEVLLRDVQSLIAQQPATGFLSTPAAAVAACSIAGDAPSLIGRVVGPYTICAELGAGGMGEVYRAREARLDRDVAIKVLPRFFTRNPDRLARFEREARLLAALNHPNIGAIYALEAVDGVPALVLELVEGHTLAERLNADDRTARRLPIPQALTIARQIVGALEAAHERGIVHRDLKPANIKITPAGVVKVLDFGLAKALGDTWTPASPHVPTAVDGTRDGAIVGTSAYMSPEQARGDPVDRRTDVWAFGCVLFEMLAGKRAFGGDSRIAVPFGVTPDSDPQWAELPVDTPIPVRRLLRRSLEVDRRRRLADIADAGLDIDDALALTADDVVALPVSPDPHVRRAGWGWLALAGCTGAIATALAVSVGHFRETPPPATAVRFGIPLPTAVHLPADGNFSLSPDGRSLVFLAAGADGIERLWLLAAQDAMVEARPLPGTGITGGTSPPFWSPDSHHVVFESQHALKKVDLAGNPVERICDVPGVVLGGSWSRDDVIVFGTETSGMMRVSAGGGIAVALTALDPDRRERVHGFPTFLPDGRHFLYSRLSTLPENSGVYVGSLDASPAAQAGHRLASSRFAATFVPTPGSTNGALLILNGTTLTTRPFDAGHLRISGDLAPVAADVGSLYTSGFYAASVDTLIYRSASAPLAQLTWLDRQGNVLETEGDPMIPPDSPPALSPHADRAALVRFDGRSMDVWIAEFGRGMTRLTSEPGLKSAPVWSPNAERIAFSSSRNGSYDLYAKNSNGEGAEELLFKSDQNKYPTSWSHDGRYLLFASQDAKAGLDLQVLPMTGSAEARRPFAFLQSASSEIGGVFSPDDNWVAYTSDESGLNEIYVRSFGPPAGPAASAGARRLVSSGGGTQPRWQNDGRMIFYLAPNGDVMAVDLTFRPGLDSGRPRRLFQLPATRNWDADANGRRFLFALPTAQDTPPFTVVTNWQHGLTVSPDGGRTTLSDSRR